MGKSAREIAVSALISYKQTGSWPEFYLKQEIKKHDLSVIDAALATTITYGVLQNIILIDYWISSFSKIKPKKMQDIVINSIRIAVYQLRFLDKIPSFAAINESVNIIKRTNRNAAGFANAVLRNISRQEEMPMPSSEEIDEFFSVKYSHPRWLVKKLIDEFGTTDAEKYLIEDNSVPQVVIQTNSLKTTPDALYNELIKNDIDVCKFDTPKGAFSIKGSGAIDDIPLFKEGMFYVQDNAARISVEMSNVKAGSTVIDMCSAPGGKSIAAAMLMGNKGKIYSCDIYDHKVDIISKNATRLGISIINAMRHDATLFNSDFEEIADLVICDVPCSGIGVIRKKPDIRYKPWDEIEGLPKLQMQIISNASRYVKKGGRLLYSTCTVFKEENEDIVNWFLDNNKNFRVVMDGDKKAVKTFLPYIDGTDGFFACVLERI